ncbi:MAG: Bro-N domain-containing protein [Proteobacteria bacterium]|nr:Bro-N domain-containing protein [Pseudomonadota bacterium]
MPSTSIKLFENRNIRALWDDAAEKWYFSVVDIVGVLTDQPFQDGARNYWKVLKNRLKAEGNETVTNCNQLKLMAADGKMRVTDVADTEQILRLIQSIPSKKAEPFKLWLARVGNDRIDEMADPELAINRALDYYKRLGYSEGWILQRLKSIEVRKELTNEWERGGIKQGKDFAILTDEMYSEWAGLNTREYKKLKGLRKESLRDNMTNIELVLNMLAEVTTTEIAKRDKPKGIGPNLETARQGAGVAKTAKIDYEKRTGKRAISGRNAKELKKIS